MKTNPHFLKVLLDKNATIIEFECTLRETEITSTDDIIGKNWFDTFIDAGDKENVLRTFNELLNNQTAKWETYKNDICCLNGSHKYIDFINEVITKDDEKFISSYGVENMDNL